METLLLLLSPLDSTFTHHHHHQQQQQQCHPEPLVHHQAPIA
jgi:hypothetical protein